jgi:hypothetical protein
MKCEWPKSYWHITREVLNDSKRFARNGMRNEILAALQSQLDKNKTRTMTFTEDGLQLAIDIVKNMS